MQSYLEVLHQLSGAFGNQGQEALVVDPESLVPQALRRVRESKNTFQLIDKKGFCLEHLDQSLIHVFFRMYGPSGEGKNIVWVSNDTVPAPILVRLIEHIQIGKHTSDSHDMD